VDRAYQRRLSHQRHQLLAVHRGLKAAEVDVDRKLLADIAVRDAAAFAKLVGTARQALAA